MKETTLWNKAIAQVKEQWKHFSPHKPTWELGEDMMKYYPILFQ
jgi:hypothetical protein